MKISIAARIQLLVSIVVIVALLCGCPAPAQAATYYVRVDGGLHTVCDGTADAPAPPPSSTARPVAHCAWNNIMEALPPSLSSAKHAALIKGGDTVMIGPGTYRIGYQAGVYDHNTMYDACDGRYASSCTLQPVPSGTASQPTRILGQGWDSGCSAPPELYGAQSVNQVIDLDSASNVVIACLGLTDHEACTLGYKPDSTKSCVSTWVPYNTPPDYGDWADKGIHAQDSSNVTLQDLNIHGFADMGIQAGRISNWTVTRVTIAGNGNVGWNGDLGGNGTNSTNSGTLKFTDLTVKYNGCQEDYPTDGQYNMCYGQEQGGYGDGLGTAQTGGTWVFIRPKFYRNVSDGLDLLYADGTGSVTVDHGFFARNVGNDLKTSGPATVTNSVFIAQCTVFRGTGQPVAGNPCRAGGGEVANFTGPNQTVTWAYNTLVGEASCLFGGDPTYDSGGGDGGAVQSSDVYDIRNSVFIVKPKWNGDGQACLFWAGDPPNNPATVNWTNVWVWPSPRESGRCTTAGITCKDPLLKDESMPTFDIIPLSGSPILHTGVGAPPSSYVPSGN